MKGRYCVKEEQPLLHFHGFLMTNSLLTPIRTFVGREGVVREIDTGREVSRDDFLVSFREFFHSKPTFPETPRLPISDRQERVDAVGPAAATRMHR